MRGTIDEAGRVVIPKRLRDQIGLRSGAVDITVDGTVLRIDPISEETLGKESGRLVIPASGASLDDEGVRMLRLADQR